MPINSITERHNSHHAVLCFPLAELRQAQVHFQRQSSSCSANQVRIYPRCLYKQSFALDVPTVGADGLCSNRVRHNAKTKRYHLDDVDLLVFSDGSLGKSLKLPEVNGS